MLIYKYEPRSYKRLPLRIAELGMMHRYEKSGALTGLHRVREMTLNDAHIFVRPEQINEEFQRVVNLLVEVYKTLILLITLLDFHVETQKTKKNIMIMMKCGIKRKTN